MTSQTQENHPAVKGALWGAVVGAAGAGCVLNYVDEWMLFAPSSASRKFENSSIKAIVGAAVAGAAIGAFVSAKNHKSWADKVEETSPQAPFSR